MWLSNMKFKRNIVSILMLPDQNQWRYLKRLGNENKNHCLTALKKIHFINFIALNKDLKSQH